MSEKVKEWPLAVEIGVPIASVLVFCAVCAITYFLDDPGLYRIKRRQKMRQNIVIVEGMEKPDSSKQPDGSGTNDNPGAPANGVPLNGAGDLEGTPLMAAQTGKVRNSKFNKLHTVDVVEPQVDIAASDPRTVSPAISVASVPATSSGATGVVTTRTGTHRKYNVSLSQDTPSGGPATPGEVAGNVPRRRTQSESTVDVAAVKKTSETQVHLDVLLARMGPRAPHVPGVSRFFHGGHTADGRKRRFFVTSAHTDGRQGHKTRGTDRHSSAASSHGGRHDMKMEPRRVRSVSQDDCGMLPNSPGALHSPTTSVASIGSGIESAATFSAFSSGSGVYRFPFSYNPQATVTSIASAFATIPVISEETDM